MGREERRKKAKQDKKANDKKVEAMRWIQSLPPAKAELISSYAKMMADRDNKHFIDALDRCYTAAMAIEFEYLEYDQLQGVMETFSILIEQDARKMRKLQDLYGGSIDMATKKVNEYGPAVEKRVRELVAEGKNQKQTLEILRLEFNSLSNAMLTNAFKKTKLMIKEEQRVNDVIEAGEKMKEVVESLGKPEIDTEEALEYIFEEKEEGYSEPEEITIKELDKHIEEAKEDELEVINEVRIVDLKGKYATYHAENKTVEVNGELSFTCDLEVIEWANDEVKALENRIAAIKGQSKETIKVIKKYL